MKRILVTGVTGTIGANLASRLLERGYAVRYIHERAGRPTGVIPS